MEQLMLAMPLYTDSVHVAVARRFFRAHSERVRVTPVYSQTSLLANGFNHLWVNAKKAGVKYFLMLHGDVEPMQPDWVDVLLDELLYRDAGLLGCVIPIKNGSGLTSTAVGSPDNPWRRTRLTLEQCYDNPTTFTAADCGHPNAPLLINTGCMLVDMTRGWTEQAYFTIRDAVVDRQVLCEPEDWFFSRRAWELGETAYATTALRVRHHGSAEFTNRLEDADVTVDRGERTGMP